jgi:hypothetical protein
MSSFYEDEDRAIEPAKAGTVQVEETRAMSEVKAQVFMARKFPRDIIAAQDRIMAECDRLKLAEKAIYSFPRGTSTITGPSIRLAEALKRGYGNMMSGLVEVERNEKESSMLAYAWDIESNTMRRLEFKVPHTRDTKQGKKALTDDRDIYEMTANQGARRERACILGLIPGDIVEAAVSRCEKTLIAKVGDLATVIPKMLDKFADIGVTKAMIEKRLRHHIEATQPAEVVQLGNVFNSIHDGMGSIADFFEVDHVPEDIIKPATPSAPAPAHEDDASEIWGKLFEYNNASNLPAQAKKDIEAAIARKEENPAELRKLLTKIKAAYEEVAK